MVKLINKVIIKILPDSIRMEKQYHKSNKLIKIVMELIVLHNKECSTTKVIKLLNKKEAMILNKQTIIIILNKMKLRTFMVIGSKLINK
jgi:hypothetical protein